MYLLHVANNEIAVGCDDEEGQQFISRELRKYISVSARVCDGCASKSHLMGSPGNKSTTDYDNILYYVFNALLCVFTS